MNFHTLVPLSIPSLLRLCTVRSSMCGNPSIHSGSDIFTASSIFFGCMVRSFSLISICIFPFCAVRSMLSGICVSNVLSLLLSALTSFLSSLSSPLGTGWLMVWISCFPCISRLTAFLIQLDRSIPIFLAASIHAFFSAGVALRWIVSVLFGGVTEMYIRCTYLNLQLPLSYNLCTSNVDIYFGGI